MQQPQFGDPAQTAPPSSVPAHSTPFQAPPADPVEPVPTQRIEIQEEYSSSEVRETHVSSHPAPQKTESPKIVAPARTSEADVPDFLKNTTSIEDVNDVNAEFENLFGGAQEPEESFHSHDGHNTSFGVNKEEEVV